jgi:hypothetical protein
MFYSGIMPAVEAPSRKFETLACVLDERTRRPVAEALVQALVVVEPEAAGDARARASATDA